MYLLGTPTSHIILPPPRKYQLAAALVEAPLKTEHLHITVAVEDHFQRRVPNYDVLQKMYERSICFSP